MGKSWSKSRIPGWPEIRERMRKQTQESAVEPAVGVGAASQDLANRGALTTSNTKDNNQTVAWVEAQEEEEEVGFPVRPQVPVRPMTYKAAFDLSFFLKEKGGLEGLVWSRKRQEILDLWVYHTQGFFPDWQNYTPGPGIRYPLTFGWCFKLVPLSDEAVEEATEGDNNALLHPICQHGVDDDHKQVLVWRFDSALARRHIAKELHPDFYKNC
uniref:Protein Nef n=1 Tax=Human immunodeficiency virus type 1 TaxID=11676 RepID=A0A2R2XFF9_HV1|nr:nef protein [Human immunodeficiency virus 1]